MKCGCVCVVVLCALFFSSSSFPPFTKFVCFRDKIGCVCFLRSSSIITSIWLAALWYVDLRELWHGGGTILWIPTPRGPIWHCPMHSNQRHFWNECLITFIRRYLKVYRKLKPLPKYSPKLTDVSTQILEETACNVTISATAFISYWIRWAWRMQSPNIGLTIFP